MNCRVLLVEDTLIAQVVEKKQMEQQGCLVDVAANGQEALEKTMGTVYDLILMDIGLGDGPDGFEVTTQIKQQSKLNELTPVVALTAHSGDEYLEKAEAVGMARYLTSPLHRLMLKRLLSL